MRFGNLPSIQMTAVRDWMATNTTILFLQPIYTKYENFQPSSIYFHGQQHMCMTIQAIFRSCCFIRLMRWCSTVMSSAMVLNSKHNCPADVYTLHIKNVNCLRCVFRVKPYVGIQLSQFPGTTMRQLCVTAHLEAQHDRLLILRVSFGKAVKDCYYSTLSFIKMCVKTLS